MTLASGGSFAAVDKGPRGGDPIVDIGGDRGGAVFDYAIRMFELRDAGAKVRFVGECDSACTLFLALPAAQTCISPGASFRFHLPRSPSGADVRGVKAFMMRAYPRWVRSWIEAQGGLQADLVTMDFATANRHLRVCV